MRALRSLQDWGFMLAVVCSGPTQEPAGLGGHAMACQFKGSALLDEDAQRLPFQGPPDEGEDFSL